MPLVSMYIYLTLVVAYTYNTSHFHARFGHFNVNSSSSLISSMLNQQYWIMDICCTNQQYLSLQIDTIPTPVRLILRPAQYNRKIILIALLFFSLCKCSPSPSPSPSPLFFCVIHKFGVWFERAKNQFSFLAHSWKDHKIGLIRQLTNTPNE